MQEPNDQMAKFKAVLVDYDGSLASREHVLSNRLRQVINRASQQTRISLASGRPYQGRIQRLLDELKLPGPHILWAGGAIYDWTKSKIVWRCIIPSRQVRKIIKVVQHHHHEFIVDEDFDSYSLGGVQNPFYLGPWIVFKNIKDLPNRSVIKMLISAGESLELVNQLERKLLDGFPNLKVIKWVHGSRCGIDITASSKLEAVSQYLKLTGTKRDELMVIGDGYNDYPLLMAGGFKVAMGNAVPEVKAIADYIAPSVDEEGVAHVLEKFVL